MASHNSMGDSKPCVIAPIIVDHPRLGLACLLRVGDDPLIRRAIDNPKTVHTNGNPPNTMVIYNNI